MDSLQKKSRQAIFVCLLYLTYPSFGQKFELEANFGPALFNNVQINSRPASELNKYATYNSYSGMLGITHNLKKWQLGLEIGVIDFAYKYKPEPPKFFLVFPEYSLNIASPALSLKLSVGRKINLIKKICIYYGVSLGPSIAFSDVYEKDNSDLLFDKKGLINNKGLAAGFYFGCSYPVAKRLAINAEIRGDYLYMRSSILRDSTYHSNTFTLQAGTITNLFPPYTVFQTYATDAFYSIIIISGTLGIRYYF